MGKGTSLTAQIGVFFLVQDGVCTRIVQERPRSTRFRKRFSLRALSILAGPFRGFAAEKSQILEVSEFYGFRTLGVYPFVEPPGISILGEAKVPLNYVALCSRESHKSKLQSHRPRGSPGRCNDEIFRRGMKSE